MSINLYEVVAKQAVHIDDLQAELKHAQETIIRLRSDLDRTHELLMAERREKH